MITYTAEDVINKAAADLGRYVPGEALGSVEHDTINLAYQVVLSEISKIVAINDPDEVPGDLFEVVSLLTSVFAGSAFANEPVDYNRVRDIEQRLRYLVAQTPTYETLPVLYF